MLIRQRQHRILLIACLCYFVWAFGLPYTGRIATQLGFDISHTARPVPLFGLYDFFVLLHSLMFSSLVSYAVTMLIAACLAGAVFVWSKRSITDVVFLNLLALGIVLYPLFFAGYRPAVTATANHDVRWVTEPDLIGKVVKQAQYLSETRPCDYTLRGWDANATLYYDETCWGFLAQTWAYAPQAGRAAWRTSNMPDTWVKPVCTHTPILALVESPGWSSAEAAQAYPRLALQDSPVLPSPDCRWLAVVASHVYGPRDILLIGAT